MIETLIPQNYIIDGRNMTMNVYSIAEDSPHFNHTPLAALSERTMQQLAKMLNGKKVLPSEEGYERDWRGLAALAKQKQICSAITTDNPIEKVLQFWIKNNPEKAKIGFLQQYLGTIDRWDVCDDLHENLELDTEAYIAMQRKKEFQQNSSQLRNGDDVTRSGTYDAYVMYAECDRDKAVEIMKQLEDIYGLTLFIKERDLLAGIRFEHVELTRLIEDQCKHLIVVMTDDFLNSPENNFLFNYTQALQIEYNERKIIPIIYEQNMAIPKTLKIYTLLKYYNNNVFYNFWERLSQSLQDHEPLSSWRNTRDLHTPTAPFEIEETIPEKDEEASDKEEEKVNEFERKNKKEILPSKPETITETIIEPEYKQPLRHSYSEGQLNTAKTLSNKAGSSLDLPGDVKKPKFKVRRFFTALRKNKKSKKISEPEPS